MEKRSQTHIILFSQTLRLIDHKFLVTQYEFTNCKTSFFGSHTKKFFGGKNVKVKFFPSVRLSDVLIMQIGNKRVETSVPEFSVILS